MPLLHPSHHVHSAHNETIRCYSLPYMTTPWPTTSPAVRDLIRRGAELILDPPADWVKEIHEASLSGDRIRAVAEDPVLADGIRRTNMANVMRWATYTAAHPGERVPIAITAEILTGARDLVRRGLDEASLDAFRTTQAVAWRRWMDIAFHLTDDPVILRELLDVSSLSISTFIDDTVNAMSERMRAEREELTRGSHAERRQAVSLVLEGAPIPHARAEAQLGYRLSGPQVAAVVWSMVPDATEMLEAACDVLARSARVTTRLTVAASATSWWIWLPTHDVGTPDLGDLPEVRVSLGRSGDGVDGFRSAHFQAVATQRLHAQLGVRRRQLVTYDEIRLVSLLIRDSAATEEFVDDTLGDLITADDDLRATIHTWISVQCNTSRTAELLYTHRNTIIRRLARADELLPRPIAENMVDVAVALELLRWRE